MSTRHIFLALFSVHAVIACTYPKRNIETQGTFRLVAFLKFISTLSSKKNASSANTRETKLETFISHLFHQRKIHQLSSGMCAIFFFCFCRLDLGFSLASRSSLWLPRLPPACIHLRVPHSPLASLATVSSRVTASARPDARPPNPLHPLGAALKPVRFSTTAPFLPVPSLSSALGRQ